MKKYLILILSVSFITISFAQTAEEFYLLAENYFLNEMYEEAVYNYSLAIELQPSNHVLFRKRAKAFLMQNRLREAVNDYTEIINIKPDQVFAYYNRAECFYNLGLFENSIDDYSFVIKHYHKFAQAYYKRGSCNFYINKFEKAIEDLKEATKLKKYRTEYFVTLSDVYSALGNYKEAFNVLLNGDEIRNDKSVISQMYFLRKYFIDNREEARRLYSEGEKLFDQDKINEAIEYFYKALQLTPDFAHPYSRLAICYEMINKPEDALQNHSIAIFLHPTEGDFYYQRAIYYKDTKNHGKAITDLSKYFVINKNYKAYLLRGDCYLEIGKYYKAYQDYSNALLYDPYYEVIYFNRANCLAELKMYREAVNDYTKAIELNSKYEEAYFNRAILGYFQLEKYTEALDDLNKLINLNNSLPSYFNNRGVAKFKLGKYNEAVIDYDKALELDPYYSIALSNKENALQKIKQENQ